MSQHLYAYYLGNVTTYAYGDASVEEIQRKSLAEVAAMAREPVASVNYEEYIQDLVDFVEVHKGQGLMETPVVGLGSPTLSQSVFDSFPLDTDFMDGGDDELEECRLAVGAFDVDYLQERVGLQGM